MQTYGTWRAEESWTGARLLQCQAVAPMQRDGDELCDAGAGLARAIEQHALLHQAGPRRAQRRKQACAASEA